LVMEVNGPVTPVMLSFIERGIEEAEGQGAEALVIMLNTPGGDVELTRKIIETIIGSNVPVAVYVAPRGAFAASAGTFITLAGHVAAMAPATSIGAASPVSGQGEEIPETLRDKISNILQAEIEGLAQRRGEKAVEWAREAVSEARAATAEEALELGVIDFIANDLDDLLRQMDGFSVTLHDRQEVTLQTADAATAELPMTPIEQFLHTITNPNIAYILMLIGIYGLIFEFANPGAFVPGVLGAISLLLALFALQVLPINYAGLGLMLLGIGLMVGEAFVPSFGILGIGGVIAFVIGSVMLIDTDARGFGISLALIGGVALFSAGLFATVMGLIMRARQRPVVSGSEEMIGAKATALEDFEREGPVRAHGELWTAASDTPVRKGQILTVVAMDGLRLKVTTETEKQTKGA